jgi:hypothetical protein
MLQSDHTNIAVLLFVSIFYCKKKYYCAQNAFKM